MGRHRCMETEWQEGQVHESGRPLSGRDPGRGVTASIVARKRRNGRGAKGRREVEDGMDRRTEEELAAVSAETKQARDIRARWNWVEPEVWTDRMLTALEQGVKGGQWFSYRWTNVFFCGTRAVLSVRAPCFRTSILRQGDPLTGEPDAGDPPVRFGGRGNSGSPYP